MNFYNEVLDEFSGLTRKQAELLRFLRKYTIENGCSPSFEEMKTAINLRSKSGIHRLIHALEERGKVSRLANRARSVTPSFDNSVHLRLPDEIEQVLFERVALTGDTLERVTVNVLRDALFPKAA